MEEYIKTPSWIKDLDYIKSENIERFKKTILEQEKNLIDLNYLRSYYRENRNSFTDLVDELQLRGFEIYTIRPNNLFNKNQYSPKHYILSNDKSDFNKIDFEKYLIGNFISRFKVVNKDFFDYLTLEGFKIFNSDIDLKSLKDDLIKSDFEVLEINSESIVDKTSEIVLTSNGWDEEKDNSMEEVEELEEVYGQDKIEKYFSENSYLIVLRFLKDKGINYLSEITNEIVIEFCRFKGAGKAKIRNFKDKLIELYREDEEYLDINYNIFHIDFALSEIDFEDIRSFLKTNVGIQDIEDINEEVLELILQQKGVRNKKVEKIQEVIIEFQNIERKSEDKKTLSLSFNGYWYEVYKEEKINDILKIFGFEDEINSNLRLKDINNKDLIELGLESNKDLIIKVSKLINKTKKLEEIFKNTIEKISDNNQQLIVLEERYNNGLTLSSIGDMFNVTRERIRQLQKKTEEKIITYIKSEGIYESLILESKNKDYCEIKELMKYIPKGKEYIVKILLNNIENLYYFKPLNLLYLRNFKDIEEKIFEIIEELPDIFIIYDYLDYLIEQLELIGIKDVSVESIEELLMNYNYKIHGEYATNKQLTILECLNELFKNHVKEPIRMDEHGAKKVIELVKKYFDEDYNKSVRAIEARIRDNRDIILVDRLTFIHINNYKFNKEYLVEVFNFIKNALIDREFINIETVFNENREGCLEAGIKNKMSLYSLIQYYYNDEFKIGKGNTLDIYRSDNIEILNRDDMLISTIKELGGKTTKEEINKILGWSDFKIENTISDSNLIIRNGKILTTLDYFNVTEEEKKEMELILSNLFKKDGFTTSYLLFKEMKFNNLLGEFIKRNEIETHEFLSSVVKKIFNNISGHVNYLYNEESEYKNIEDAIRHKFNGIFYKDEVKEFIYSYGYKDMMVSRSINNLVENGYFIEISSDKFINKKDFNIDENVKVEVVNYINEKIADNEYLSLSMLKGYRNILSEIDYKWTPQLIKSILIKEGYRQLRRVYQDQRYEKIIVVKNDSDIKSYSDLIYYVIKNEYEGNMHETKIYDFLASKGLVLEQEDIFDKKIPYDLKVTDKISIDEVGRVELK